MAEYKMWNILSPISTTYTQTTAVLLCWTPDNTLASASSLLAHQHLLLPCPISQSRKGLRSLPGTEGE